MRVLWIDDGLQWKPAIFGRKSRYQIKENEPVVASPEPHPSPAPARRQAKAGKPVKQTRQAKPAHPRMDINGRLLSSRKINDTDVISQAEARKVLGVSCVQMLRLEGQKVLTRVQENGSRLVYYAITEVQRLIDLIDRTPPPPL